MPVSTAQAPRVRSEVCWWSDPDEPLPEGLRFAEVPEINPSEMLEWGAPKNVSTRNGLRELIKAAPTPEFVELWANPLARRQLRDAGITISEYQGKTEVAWWRDPTLDLDKIEASRATKGAGNLVAPKGEAYLPFQAAGIEYCVGRGGALIADEMGLGKTIQALGVVNNAKDVGRVLVVAPVSLRENWLRESRKWRVDGAPACAVKPGKPLPDGPVTAVAPYSMLTRLKDQLVEDDWDLVVYDEAHYLKNPESQRSQAASEIVGRRELFLTGTPVLNRPVEIWPIISRIDPNTWDDWYQFTRAYCNGHHEVEHGVKHWVVDGASNLEELQLRLRESGMLRRLKADVLPELPPKRRQVLGLPLAEEDRAFVGAVDDNGFAALSDALDRGEGYDAAPFTLISGMMQAIGEAKAKRVGEAVAEMVEEAGKVVVFAHHHAVIDEIESVLAGKGICGVVKLTGRDAPAARQAAVDRFQADAGCQVFIGGIAAAGVGLTLTAASNVVFAELPWRPADVTQAEDRCHRIGQLDAVNVRHFVLHGTLDERVVELLVDKQHIIDRALDAEVDWQNAPAPEDVRIRLAPERALRMTPESVEAMGRERLHALWRECDGVSSQDGMGFSLATVGAGNALLAKDAWTLGDLQRAVWVCTVHRGQLAGASLDHDEFMRAAAEGLAGVPDAPEPGN